MAITNILDKLGILAQSTGYSSSSSSALASSSSSPTLPTLGVQQSSSGYFQLSNIDSKPKTKTDIAVDNIINKYKSGGFND